MRIFAFLAIATIAISTLSAYAQDFRFYETLSQMNRIDPVQNPRIRQGTQIQNSNIQDQKNKVVGHVRDVVLEKDGGIASLSIEFDNMNLPSEVYFTYDERDIKSYSDGYGLSLTEDRIMAVYPELLANIETASGDASDRYSMNTLIGAKLKKPNGEKMGTVKNVMFNKEATEARGLFIEMTRQGMKGEQLSIPFDAVMVKTSANAKPQLIVEHQKAQAIIEYVKARR